MGREGRLACLADRGLAPRPRARRLYCSARPIILRVLGRKQRKGLLGRVGGPAVTLVKHVVYKQYSYTLGET